MQQAAVHAARAQRTGSSPLGRAAGCSSGCSRRALARGGQAVGIRRAARCGTWGGGGGASYGRGLCVRAALQQQDRGEGLPRVGLPRAELRPAVTLCVGSRGGGRRRGGPTTPPLPAPVGGALAGLRWPGSSPSSLPLSGAPPPVFPACGSGVCGVRRTRARCPVDGGWVSRGWWCAAPPHAPPRPPPRVPPLLACLAGEGWKLPGRVIYGSGPAPCARCVRGCRSVGSHARPCLPCAVAPPFNPRATLSSALARPARARMRPSAVARGRAQLPLPPPLLQHHKRAGGAQPSAAAAAGAEARGCRTWGCRARSCAWLSPCV